VATTTLPESSLVGATLSDKILQVLGVVSYAMQITIGKILAVLIALAYVIAMTVHASSVTVDVFKGSVALLLPLALIWFPDELGSMTGYLGRGGKINTETPPILVSIAGWFLLAGLPVLLHFLS
jgi:hypothetical protein